MKSKLLEVPEDFPLGKEVSSFYTNNDPESLRALMNALIDFAKTMPPEGVQFWLAVASKINHHRENVKRAHEMMKASSK